METHRSRAQAGLTLVELMVVVAILAILGVIGVPSLRGLLPRIRFKNDMMVLSNEIALVRVRAITKSSGFSVVLHPETDRYVIVKSDGGQQFGETRMSGTNLYHTGLFNPVTSEFVPPDPPDPPPPFTLNFAANGQVQNIPLGKQAFIELRTPDGSSAGDFRTQLRVEPTGRVVVWRWAGGDWRQE